MGKTIRFGNIKYPFLTLLLPWTFLPMISGLAEGHAIDHIEIRLEAY